MDINKVPSMWTLIVQQFKKDPFAILCLIVFITVLFASFVVGNMVDEDYITRMVFARRNLPPGGGNGLLGTDEGGRDMLRMLLLSARNSLALAMIVTIATFTIGFTVGLIAGFYGEYVDMFILRIIDFFVMVPNLMVIIAMNAILPRWDTPTFAMVMIALGWFTGARLLRARVLQESAKDYILASKTLGTPNYKIIFKKVLPNVMSIMMVQFILGMAGNIGFETGLTVIGYGLPFGTPSLGRLISLARDPIVMLHRQWQWLPAAILIVVVTICIYGIGNAVRRAVNPRQRRH